MRAFLDFVGDRPIIAHNASFDTGFMAAACERSGIKFEPVVLDTLVLSQRLLPELKRHKLDIVSPSTWACPNSTTTAPLTTPRSSRA